MAWNLKQKVHVNNPHTLQELENEIRRMLGEITEREREREREKEGERERERERVCVLQKVIQNFVHRCDHFIQKGGNHFQRMLSQKLRLTLLSIISS